MNKRVIVYRLLRGVFKPLFHLIFRPRILGRENIPKSGSAVIAGNHKHALDPILVDISTPRVVRTLAKKDLHDGPFGSLFKSAGTIPVDLHASRNPDALNSAVEALEAGELVNVSPEAKRNYTDELLLPFKYGAAVMSGRTGAPIVPYAIAGDYKPFGKRLTVVFGKPIYPDGDDSRALNKRLYCRVGALLKKITPREELANKHLTKFEEWEN